MERRTDEGRCFCGAVELLAIGGPVGMSCTSTTKKRCCPCATAFPSSAISPRDGRFW